MIVANKFQTGFDQPKLCAMYLDKRASGVEAVRTLSRLNCTTAGKDTTCVIDFANESEEILAAFRTYYDAAEVGEAQDCDVLYSLKDQLQASGLYRQAEVDEVARILTTELHATTAGARPVNAVEPAVTLFNGRMKELNDTIERWERATDRRDVEGDERGGAEAEAQRAEYGRERDDLVKLRDGMTKFVRLYEFIAQVVPLDDPELEKLARFIRLYRKRLADVPAADIDLAGLQVTHWSLNERPSIDMALGVAEPAPTLSPVSGGIAPGKDRARERISEIIRALNDLFGDELSDADRIKQASNPYAVGEAARRDDTVRKQLAADNTEEQMLQGGDLKRAVSRAVFEMMAE